MTDLALGNVVGWGIQVAAVTALGLALPAAIRVSSPRARLIYFRALLGLCLLLPLLQPWQPVAPASLTGTAQVALTVQVPDPGLAAGTPEPGASWTLPAMLAAVYLGGVLIRLGWLGLGLWSLRRLRRTSGALVPRPAAVDEAALLTGVDADFRVSDRVARPATFGWRRPIVIVPAAFTGFSPAQQRAVAAHELLHVRRRDWLRALADAAVLTACWFHPLLWWLVDQIQLSVEQVVDRDVVELVGERRPYLEALLSLAAAGPTPHLQPASMFLKHGHLTRRVALLVKEGSMSRARLVVSFLVVAAVVLTGAWAAVQAFPLQVPAAGVQAPPPPPPPPPPPTASSKPEKWAAVPTGAVRIGDGIQPPKKIVHVSPEYPPDALKAGIEGVVVLEAIADEAGKVKDTRVLKSASPALIDAATAAVKKWEFTPTLLNGKAVPVVMTVTVSFLAKDKTTGSGIGAAGTPPPPPPPPPAPKGDKVLPPPPPPPPPPPDAVRVGGADGIQPPQRIKDVRPVYPQAAKDAGIQGIVILEAVIGPDGKVQSTKVVRSVPELDQAARETVSQWEFTPTVKNGKAVPVIMTMTVNFTLK